MSGNVLVVCALCQGFMQEGFEQALLHRIGSAEGALQSVAESPQVFELSHDTVLLGDYRQGLSTGEDTSQ
jgi:hypothetical protein